jgi:hypothetical protein
MKFCNVVCEVLDAVLNTAIILRVLTQVKSNSVRFTGKEVSFHRPAVKLPYHLQSLPPYMSSSGLAVYQSSYSK